MHPEQGRRLHILARLCLMQQRATKAKGGESLASVGMQLDLQVRKEHGPRAKALHHLLATKLVRSAGKHKQLRVLNHVHRSPRPCLEHQRGIATPHPDHLHQVAVSHRLLHAVNVRQFSAPMVHLPRSRIHPMDKHHCGSQCPQLVPLRPAMVAAKRLLCHPLLQAC